MIIGISRTSALIHCCIVTRYKICLCHCYFYISKHCDMLLNYDFMPYYVAMRMSIRGAKFIRFIKLIDQASSACHVVANYLLNHCPNWGHRTSYSEYIYALYLWLTMPEMTDFVKSRSFYMWIYFFQNISSR